jgi:hypothetical protein
MFSSKLKLKAFAPDKIKIPLELLINTISLLDSLDIEDQSPDVIQLYGYVLHAFNKKKTNLEYLGALHDFLCCEDAHERFVTHMNSELWSSDDPPF